MPEIPLPPEILKEIMNELRDQTHAEMEKELQERMEKSPEPNEEELRIGAFREELEPQVRDAILEFFRKGYSTESSGFYEDQSGEEIQAIDGYFEIDKETEAKLKALGARVLRGPETGLPYQNEKFTRIQFKPNTPDLRDMKQQWDAIAAFMEAQKHFPFPVHCLQTDNGGENRGDFHKYLERLGIRHVFIPKSSPWWSGHVERFHGVIDQEYWLNPFRAFRTIEAHLHFYDTDRIHLGHFVNGLTPLEVLIKSGLKVSPLSVN